MNLLQSSQRILADSGIVALEDLLPNEVALRRFETHPSPADLLWADALLVRTVTSVTPDLLKGTPVRWVGTATAGRDHIQLGKSKLPVVSAPGCNARAVAEYVASVLTRFGGRSYRHLHVVGFGPVGQTVAGIAERMGLKVTAADPLIPPESIPESLRMPPGSADVVSLHMNLHDGIHSSRDWWTSDLRRSFPALRLFINAARGAVVSESVHPEPGYLWVQDCWRHEPEGTPDLAAAIDLATPHLAGYSREAKRRASEWMLRAAQGEPVGGASRPQDHWDGTVWEPVPVQDWYQQWKEDGFSAAGFRRIRAEAATRPEWDIWDSEAP